ncbi:MAG: two-component system response regulator [Coriobacteriaceae bacterium]|nr:two-component system response regulator [Coriobacteriaceae bacterium]
MREIGTLLLAEDNPKDAELTLMALEKHNLANKVLWVHDGEAVLDYMCRRGEFADRPNGNPAVILLDLKMAKVDGMEVLRAIRSDPSLRTTPVVILTSSREERDLVESYSLGVNAYVVKPVKFDEFFEAVGQLGVFWAITNEPPPDTAR